MDWTMVVSIVGILGTWVTIVLVFFTLREMRNQRIAAQKPDLIIAKPLTISAFSYRKEGQTSLLIPKWWKTPELRPAGKHSWLDSYPVNLYNVGFGAAKNIKLKWQIEYDKTLQQIKDYCYQNSIPIVLRLQEDTVSIIEKDEGNNIVDGSYFLRSPEINETDFLMPASVTKEGLTSFTPQSMKQIISIIFYLRDYHNKKYIDWETPPDLSLDFPTVELELYYDDVEDSHYSKKFDVVQSYNFSHSMEEKLSEGLEFSSYLRFEFKMITK